MTRTMSTIERAWELARSGSCRTIAEIRKALRAEKFDLVDSHIAGKAIALQLQTLIKAARERRG